MTEAAAEHKVIFNGDWGAMFWAPNLWQPEGGPYSAKALHNFVDLLDAGVDWMAETVATRATNSITIRSIELAVC